MDRVYIGMFCAGVLASLVLAVVLYRKYRVGTKKDDLCAMKNSAKNHEIEKAGGLRI